MGDGGQQVRGVAVGVPGPTNPLAVHPEDRLRWTPRLPLVVVAWGVVSIAVWFVGRCSLGPFARPGDVDARPCGQTHCGVHCGRVGVGDHLPDGGLRWWYRRLAAPCVDLAQQPARGVGDPPGNGDIAAHARHDRRRAQGSAPPPADGSPRPAGGSPRSPRSDRRGPRPSDPPQGPHRNHARTERRPTRPRCRPRQRTGWQNGSATELQS